MGSSWAGRTGVGPGARRGRGIIWTAVLIGLWAVPTTGFADEKEGKPPWEARVAAGFALRGGDTNQFSLNGDTRVRRNFEVDSLTLRGLADWGKTGGSVDSENYGGFLDWRHDFTPRFFWLSSTGVSADPVQDRNIRVEVSSGPGYRLWQESENEFFDVNSGLGYRHEQFRKGKGDNDFVEMTGGYDYHDMIGDKLEVEHSTNLRAPLNEIEGFIANSEITLSIPLVGSLHFRNNARYEFVYDPADDSKKSNYWLTIGLEYRL